MIKRLIGVLPPTISDWVHGTLLRVVRLARMARASRYSPWPPQKRRASDLRWGEFRDRILSKRGGFKGVFIQEYAVEWDIPLYQRPQHIAGALGRLGYLVIFKTRGWGADDVEGFRQVCQNVWITNRPEVDGIDGATRSCYSTAFTLSPRDLERARRTGLLIYEYIDHIDPRISGDIENVRRLVALKEFAFGGGSDYVVASARKLEAEAIASVGRGKVVLIPNGVDTRHYRDLRHQGAELPEALLSFRRTYAAIIGYFGALAPWLWYDAIAELVAARVDLGFVFLGPDYYGGSRQLPVAANVMHLGPIEYGILPAYAAQFDVCFIPFSPGEIAQTTSPLKLFEYFALEKPVVVTSDMLECVAFPEVFHGESASALSQALDKALAAKDDPAFKARLAELADQNDWSQRAKAMEVMFGVPGRRE